MSRTAKLNYETSPKVNGYRSNKSLQPVNPGTKYEEQRQQQLPVIHRYKRNNKSELQQPPTTGVMKTVGVLDYSTDKSNGKGKTNPEVDNPRGRTVVDRSKYNQLPEQSTNRMDPKRRNITMSEALYGSHNARPRRYNHDFETRSSLQQDNNNNHRKTQQSYPRGSPRRITDHDRDFQHVQGNITYSPLMENEDQYPLKISPTKEGLSTTTKLEVLSKNKQLIYKETVWTKRRIDKLKDSGFGSDNMIKRLKTIKEERRWDLIMKYIREDTTIVNKIWQFLGIEYPDLYAVLNQEYQNLIRNHFRPIIANLHSTPSNANKMVGILMDYGEEYDRYIYKLDQSLSERERELKGVKEVLDEARKVVYTWGGMDIPETNDDENIKTVSQELLDTVRVVSAEKDQQLENQMEINAELKKKVARLNKALKEKGRQQNDTRVNVNG